MVVALGFPHEAAAQYAAMGDHYPRMGNGGGLEAISPAPTGGLPALIPLQLPPARGGLEIPLHVVYSNSAAVGDAGAGWDIPISYVRISNGFSGRKPKLVSPIHSPGLPGSAPEIRTQVMLSLGGGPQPMNPTGEPGVYRALVSGSYLELRDDTSASDSWIARDASGVEYTFSKLQWYDDDNRWFLSRVRDRTGKNVIALAYERDFHLHWSCDLPQEVRLSRIEYSHASNGCAKQVIRLEYAPEIAPIVGGLADIGFCAHHDDAQGPSTDQRRLFSLRVVDGEDQARTQLLQKIRVLSHTDTTCSAETLLREYRFTYQKSPDNDAPQLAAVDMAGTDGGTSGTVPVVRYSYGKIGSRAGWSYGSVMAAPRSGAANQESVAFARKEGDYFVTNQMVRDFTGDGMADDVVFNRSAGTLTIGTNVTSDSGTHLDTAVQTMAVPGVTALDAQRLFPSFPLFWVFCRWNNDTWPCVGFPDREETFNQVLDWNGDGRLDLLAAQEDNNDRWTVWLNTPGATPGSVTWSKRYVDVRRLRAKLVALHHLALDGLRLPLARALSWAGDLSMTGCLRWQWDPEYANHTSWPDGWSKAHCAPTDSTSSSGDIVDAHLPFTSMTRADFGRKFGQWKLLDVNGDGLPDLVFTDTPAAWKSSFGPTQDDVKFNSCFVKQCPKPFWNPGPSAAFSPQCECADEEHLAQPRGHTMAFLNTSREELAFAEEPITLFSEGGVEQWDSHELYQTMLAGFVDVNGDGIVDWVGGQTAHIRTGEPGEFSGEIQMPGPLMTFKSDMAPRACTGTNQRTTWQENGLIDLNGDGIPDYVSSEGGWHVRAGNGGGFGPAQPIVASGFSMSETSTVCDGSWSWTTSELFDVDGDGRPEVVHQAGSRLALQSISGATGGAGALDAGRLISSNNGYGAVSRDTYASAKHETGTPHQLPMPEIVVVQLDASADKGLGASSAPTRFAYGDAQLEYDSLLDRFGFRGYGRTVVLKGLPSAASETAPGDLFGQAVIQERTRPSDFAEPESSVLSGLPRDRVMLEGMFWSDPRLLLTADLARDSRWRGREVSGYTFHRLNTGADASSCKPINPYTGASGVTDLCGLTGLSVITSKKSYSGTSAPANSATQYVMRDVEATDLDRLGRPTKLSITGSGDAPACLEYTFATGADDRRMLGAVASETAIDCEKKTTIARQKYFYDDQPFGRLGTNGFLTSTSAERRLPISWMMLGENQYDHFKYDDFGGTQTITRTRTEDGVSKTKTTQLEYDDFGLFPRKITESASDVATAQVTTVERDPVTSQPTRIGQPDGTAVLIDYDRLFRERSERLDNGAGAVYLLTQLDYPGDDPAQDSFTDPLRRGAGRRVHRVEAAVWNPDGDPLTALERIETTTYLDEAGRTRFVETPLGVDYANASVISDYTIYDAVGRRSFVADPFKSTDAVSAAYGTTYFYGLDSVCSNQGVGPLATSDINPSLDRYMACESASFEGNRIVKTTQGPNELQGGQPQTGAFDRTVLSAAQRVLETSRWKAGQRLDLVRYSYDALAQQYSMTRYGAPATASEPVTWTTARDSLGQLVVTIEPGLAARNYSYDEWGLQLSESWTDAGTAHVVANRYDGFGRPVRTEAYRDSESGGHVTESLNQLGYDVASGDVGHRDPFYLVGRLSYTRGDNQDVYFGYDALGQVRAQTFANHRPGEVAKIFGEVDELNPDGNVAQLSFFLPGESSAQRFDYGFDSARRIDSVSSTSTGSMPLFLAEDIDDFGKYRQVRYGSDITENWTYRADRRRELQEHKLVANGKTERVVYGARDGAGLLAGVEYRSQPSGGLDTGIRLGYAYDASNRLVSSSRITVGSRFNVILGSHAWTYDGLGNIGATTNIDVLGGAPTTQTFVRKSDDLDRLCSVYTGTTPPISCAYIYDGAGDVTHITASATQDFQYDAASRVRRISQGNLVATLDYSPAGGLAAIDINQGATTIRQDRRYGAFMEEQLLLSPSGTRVPTTEITVPGPLGPVVRLRKQGTTVSRLYSHGDLAADRWSTDATGHIVQEVSYDEYGKVTADSGSTGSLSTSNHEWNGGDALREFGLVILGPRLYDPRTGRFLQRDPISTPRSSSKAHPYAFAWGDPVNHGDRNGLDPAGVWDCAANVACIGGDHNSWLGWFTGTAHYIWEDLGWPYEPHRSSVPIANLGVRWQPKVYELTWRDVPWVDLTLTVGVFFFPQLMYVDLVWQLAHGNLWSAGFDVIGLGGFKALAKAGAFAGDSFKLVLSTDAMLVAHEFGAGKQLTGKATVFEQLIEGNRHVSILVQHGDEMMHTEQMVNGAKTMTEIVEVDKLIEPVVRRLTFVLPDAAAALKYQRGIVGFPLGVYDVSLNSCLSHVGEVLRAGGLRAPVGNWRSLMAWMLRNGTAQ